MRGLVVSPHIELTSNLITFKSSSLDSQDLRFYLLFWDKLDWPDNDLFRMDLGPDEQFLNEAGILQRTLIRGIRGFGGDALRNAHVAAFRKLDSAERGVWSIATGGRSISFLDDELTVGRGALVTLHRALPVPDADVPLAEILEFRIKRRDELLALRHHLETIYGRVRHAEDGDLALRSETERLEAAVVNFIKATQGSPLKWRLASLGANIDLAGGTAATWLAFQSGLSLIESALAGVGAAIGVKASLGLGRKHATETPFRYVSSYHNKLFRPL